MPHLTNTLRAAAAAALMGSSTCLGIATATADPNTGNSADVNTLAGSLSKGYGLNNCTAQAISSGELAVLTCGQNSDSSGPALAKYILFSSSDNLTSSFQASIKDDTLTTCGDSGQSPMTWHQGNSTTSAGQVACGTYKDAAGNNAAEIIWTTDTRSILSYIRGSNMDVASLYQWWRING